MYYKYLHFGSKIDRRAGINYTHFFPAQVFDLGADGSSAPRLAAEVPNFLKAAAAAGNGRDIFSERTPAERKGAAIVHIAVIPPSQSHR